MSAERLDEPFWRWLDDAWVKSVPFVRIVAVFLLLGPVAFNLAFAMLPLTVALVTLASWRDFLNVLMLAVGGIPFALLFGAVPAIATGLVVAVRHARSGGAGALTAVASGATFTAASGLYVMLSARGSDIAAKDLGLLAFLTLLGAVASLVCWWVAIGRRPAVTPEIAR